VIQQQRIRIRQQQPAVDLRNKLVAYDARTGETKWSHGRSAEKDDQLGDVTFLAPPVSVGDDLWVPYYSSGDLFAAVLDPVDGAVVDQVLLCTLGGRDVNREGALFPAAADGFVYVSTHHGLVFAIDADKRSVAWAHRYADSDVPRRGRITQTPVGPPGEWLSGPPVVAGRLLLLAPADHGELLAFDRLTGALRWSKPRGTHRYIVAADAGRVWLGGDEFGCISLLNQSYVWKASVAGATGHAVLSGDTIYVPTRQSLIALEADTGEVLEEHRLPSDQPPLGNLLCIGGSMISVDPSEVRAFPDRNSYEATVAALRADPTNPRLAIRLAFMELLEHRPQAALTALDRAEPNVSEGESQSVHIAHLRVEALLQIADLPVTPGDEAIVRLQKAVDASLDDRDRVRARLALGDKLRRLGRFVDSYRTLWRLAQDPISDEIIGKDGANRPARLVIADTLRRIEPELAPSQITEIATAAKAMLAEAESRLLSRATRAEGMAMLRRLADSVTAGGVDQAALNALAAFEVQRHRYEQAEQYYGESVRRGADREKTAQAALKLAELYLSPQQGLGAAAGELVDLLRNSFGDVIVEGRPVLDHLDALRGIEKGIESPTAKAMGHSSAGSSAVRFQPVGAFELTGQRLDDFASPDSGVNLRLVQVRGDRPEVLGQRVLVFLPPRVLQAYSPESGELLWETELVTENFPLSIPEEETLLEGLAGTEGRWALVGGQTAILNSEEGLHAVGVVSGKRLWARRVTGGATLREATLRAGTVDVGLGRTACVLTPGSLSVLNLADGETVWQRDLSETPAEVRIRDEFVLTADPAIETIDVYRLDSGGALARITFDQPEVGSAHATADGALPETAGGAQAAAHVVPIAFSAGVVCGPDGSRVAAYDVRTGGRLWSLEMAAPAGELFELTEGSLVIASLDGTHRVVDARSGEVRLETRLEGFPGAAVFATEEEGVLVLAGYEDSMAGEQWHFVGVDVGTGEVRWRRQFLGTLNRSHLKLAEGVIPIVAWTQEAAESSSPRSPRRGTEQQIILIDKRTGENVGDPLTWHGTQRGQQLTGDLDVWPGRMILQASDTVVRFETRPLKGGSRGVN